MAKIIKVRCNGPNKHVNEIDLDKVLRTDTVLRNRRSDQGPQAVPDRVVLPCAECTTGKVILTSDMIEAKR